MDRKSQRWLALPLAAAFFLAPAAPGQNASSTAGVSAAPEQAQEQAQGPLKITLADALRRARALNPAYHLAVTNAVVAKEASRQARDATLPALNYNSQFLYTQGNGTVSGRYIANNGVHEYIAEADAHELLSASQIALSRSSAAAAALAGDQAEIASRGLVVTVVSHYAALVAAKSKLETLLQAQSAAEGFLKTTQELERGGEVAHADVIKAEIQLSDSRVAVENAETVQEQSKIALALLLFPDPSQSFTLAENPGRSLPLPSFTTAEAEAHSRNPELRAAEDAKLEASSNVTAAWMEYLPTLTLDYFYGIDANRFAAWSHDPSLGRVRNLGYSAWAQLNLPIWNWGATHSKVRQARALHQQAALELGFAQRNLDSNLKQLYREAQAAKAEMGIRQSAAKNAEESLRLTLLQYKAGQSTALEVVTAEDTVSLERTALADAETRYATAIANLSTLTGTL